MHVLRRACVQSTVWQHCRVIGPRACAFAWSITAFTTQCPCKVWTALSQSGLAHTAAVLQCAAKPAATSHRLHRSVLLEAVPHISQLAKQDTARVSSQSDHRGFACTCETANAVLLHLNAVPGSRAGANMLWAWHQPGLDHNARQDTQHKLHSCCLQEAAPEAVCCTAAQGPKGGKQCLVVLKAAPAWKAAVWSEGVAGGE